MDPHQRKWQGANGRPCSQSKQSAESDTNSDTNGRVPMSISTIAKLAVNPFS